MVWLLALACACRESDDLAQTVVWVDAEPAARELISRVRVQAVGPTNNLEPTVETQSPDWPIKLVLAPKNDDASRRFTMHIEARDAQDSRLMTLRFATGFVANRTGYVKLLIHKECVQSRATCEVGESCNVWNLELATNQLGRDALEPRKLDAACTSSGDMAPPDSSSNAGTGGTMQADAGTAGTAGSGPTAGAGGVGSTSNGQQSDACDPGYVRSANACVDADECASSKPCGDHGRCQNVPGDYVCECDAGYQNTSGTCVETCQMNNGGCQTTCQDSAAGVVCSCGKGQWLKSDLKSCAKFGPGRRLSMTASVLPMQPHFAFDGEGNGLAVWIQSDGTDTSLLTRRYSAAGGWGTSAKLMVEDPGTAGSPRVAFDAQGRGLVVWTQTADSDSDSDIWAVRYSAQAFGEPGRIDVANSSTAYDPSVELDDNGDGFAVWTQGATQSQIWTNRFSANGGWAGPQAIDTAGTAGAFGAQLALGRDGNATLVWTESTFNTMSVPSFSPWAMRFDPTSERWQSAIALDDNGSAGGPNSQLFGPDGHGLVVWSRITNGRISVRASRYTDGAGWSNSISIAAADSELTTVAPRVALSPSGVGAAIWADYDGSQTGVWANRYDGASDQWSGATRLSAVNTTTAPLPQLAVDPSGDGFGVWSEVRGTSRTIKAWRIQADDQSDASVTLSTDVTADPSRNSEVRIDVDAQGNGLAIWDVYEMGQYQVWTSAFE